MRMTIIAALLASMLYCTPSALCAQPTDDTSERVRPVQPRDAGEAGPPRPDENSYFERGYLRIVPPRVGGAGPSDPLGFITGGGATGGVIPSPCNLPAIPTPAQVAAEVAKALATPAQIATEVNKALVLQINQLNAVIQEQEKRLTELHDNIKGDIVTAMTAPFTALGAEIGKNIVNKMDETKRWLWDQIYPILTTAAFITAIVAAVLIGFPLKVFLDWVLLGRRKRHGAPAA
jgi:hypothetical protein